MYQARLRPALYMSGLLHCIMYMMRATKLRYLVACSIVIKFVPSPLHRLDPGTAGVFVARDIIGVRFSSNFWIRTGCINLMVAIPSSPNFLPAYSLNTGSALASNEVAISASRASRSAFAQNAMTSSTQTAKTSK
jgi:hypothetical protein